MNVVFENLPAIRTTLHVLYAPRVYNSNVDLNSFLFNLPLGRYASRVTLDPAPGSVKYVLTISKPKEG